MKNQSGEPVSLEEAANTLEELQVIEEELRQQNEELIEARHSLEVERRRYQDLFELAPDGYLLTDAYGVMQEMNRAAVTMLGQQRQLLLGRPFSMFIGREDRAAYYALLTELEGGKSGKSPLYGKPGNGRVNHIPLTREVEMYLQPVAGEPFYAGVRITAVPDYQSGLTNLRWLIRDITGQKELEARLRLQVTRTEALLRTAARLNSHLDLEKVLQAVCEEVAQVLDVSIATVSLYDEKRELLELVAGYGLQPEFFAKAEPMPRELYDVYVQQFGRLTVVTDVQALDNLPNADWYKKLNVRTTVNATMLREGSYGDPLIGRLNIASTDHIRHFSDEELALLQGLADQAGLAIANAREATNRKKAEEALAEEKRRLELLYSLSQSLTRTLNPREVANRALNAIMTMLDAFRGEMFLLNLNNDCLRLVAAAGYDKESRPLLDQRTEINLGEGIPGRVAETSMALLLPDVNGNEYWLPLPGLDDEICSAAAVPLLAGDELVGVLSVLSNQADFFNEAHLNLLQAVATPIALSLQNARLYDAEHRARQSADTLRAANLALSEQLDFNAVLETLLDHLGELTPYDNAAVMLLEDDALLTIYASRPPIEVVNEGEATQRFNFNIEASPHFKVLFATQRGFMIPDTTKYPGWKPYAGSERTRSWLGSPMVAGGKLLGVFALGKKEPNFFTATHLRLVEAMAGQAAIAIQNAQLYQQVHTGREQLRGLTHQVVVAQEDERHRLSYQLHDEAGQALSALQISLTLIRDDLSDEDDFLRPRIDDAVELTTDTMDQIRTLAQMLRPPALDVVGLNLTLQNFCHDFARRSGVVVHYIGAELPFVSSAFSISFYRFLQEALSNIAKHAQAKRVQVVLNYDGQIVSLMVVDDGRGFDLEASRAAAGKPGSIGLLGMQERFALLGGHLEVETRPDQGARLIARAPWQEIT